MNHSRSEELFACAQKLIPGGVNSTARATWSGWAPYPLFVDRGEGAYLYDVDGNAYLDYLLGLGPMILGHRPPKVTAAVVEQIQNRGTVFALPTAQEARLAQKIIAAALKLGVRMLSGTLERLLTEKVAVAAANEIAVAAFVKGKIRFGAIPEVVAAALAGTPDEPLSLASVRSADERARILAHEAVEARLAAPAN